MCAASPPVSPRAARLLPARQRRRRCSSARPVTTSGATPVATDTKPVGDVVELSSKVPTALDTAPVTTSNPTTPIAVKPVTVVPAKETHLIQRIPIQRAGTEGNHPQRE